MPIITRPLAQSFSPEWPAPADTDPKPTEKKKAAPPAKTFDESTSQGWLDRVAYQLEEFSAVALNPDTSLFDLPTTEHNLDCLVCEIDEKELDKTVEWEEVKEMRKKIKKAIADMAPRFWGKGR